MEGSEPEIVWCDGDRWRDLTAEADAPLTVVSRAGTARLLDRHRHLRVPLEGGNLFYGDLAWRPLLTLNLTPCGLSLTEMGGAWSQGTPVRLVLAGLHMRWMATEIGRQLCVDLFSGQERPAVLGHPDRPCGARFCEKPRDWNW